MINHMHIYPFDLEKEVYEHKTIPRHFRYKEKMKIYHKYWIPQYNGVVKVIDVDLINGVEYYFINYNTNMNGCVTYPLNLDDSYELLHNYSSIQDNMIINEDKSYSGAEIKAWFIMKQEDLSEDVIRGFSKYLVENGSNELYDNRYYFVIQNPNSSKEEFKIIFDKSK